MGSEACDAWGRFGNQRCRCLSLAHTCLFFQQLSRRKKRTLFIMVSSDGNPGWGGGGAAPPRGGQATLLPTFLPFHLCPLLLWQTTRR